MALLETTTAEGVLKGMILGRAPHELGDQEAAYLQDVLLNKPGFAARRGAILNGISLGNHFNGSRPAGICGCYDPAGNYRILVPFFEWDSGTSYRLSGAVYDSNLTFLGVGSLSGKGGAGNSSLLSANSNVAGDGQGQVVMTPSIDGGILVSASMGYGPNASQLVAHWFGAYGTTLTTTTMGSVTITTTAGSTAFSGLAAALATLQPGMVIYGMGIVKSIDTATTGTFISPAPLNNTLALNMGMACNVYCGTSRGKISCAPGGAGTTSVTGYGTRFQQALQQAGAAPTVGTWRLYDPSDLSIIGVSASSSGAYASDTQLANGTISKSVSIGPYLLYPETFTNTQVGPWGYITRTNDLRDRAQLKGWITWSFKGYQMYSNSCELKQLISSSGGSKAVARTWIGGPIRHDQFDHSVDDGDFFDCVSSDGGDPSIYAAYGGNTAGVICKGKESFALRGNSPDDFALTKIADDGALGANAITSWRGNVIWLGRNGVYLYDGVHEPANLVGDSMGDEYSRRVAAFQQSMNDGANGASLGTAGLDSDGYRLDQARCFVYRDHLFVSITNTGSTHSVYTDGVARTSNTMQFMIYLPNNALSFLTNFNFVGYIPRWTPLTGAAATQQEGYVLIVQKGSTTHYVLPMADLFTQGAAVSDAILTANSYDSGTLSTSVGPWYHMESRKFFAGDGLLRKTWKQLSTESLLTNTKRMFMETVPGLNTTGTRVVTPYIGVGLWKALKLRFNSRDQYMSFRLYEDISNRPSTLILGAWQWGYKLARRGQV